MRPLIPNLWCDDTIDEQVEFYVSLFDDSRIGTKQYYSPDSGRDGDVMFIEFELLGQTYGAINGGPQFPYSEAVSLEARCENQDQIDRLWSAFADGGEPEPCGWIKDRYGLSWQVVPEMLEAVMSGDDDQARQRAVAYFMALDKVPFSIADLEVAVAGG